MTQPLQTNSSVAPTDAKAMEAELNGYRRRFEQEVEMRTAQLVRRIALLESCNTTLCKKLELAQRELTALKQQATVAQENNFVKQLDSIGNQVQSPPWFAEWQQDQTTQLIS